MQVSFNTYKPYVSTNKQVSAQHHKQPSFKSGFGAEEFDMIDNPEITPRSNSERWRNIAQAIKMMTIDQYRYSHEIFPKKKPLLFTPEECKKFRDSFYDGTDMEGTDPTIPTVERTSINPDDEYYSIDYSDD